MDEAPRSPGSTFAAVARARWRILARRYGNRLTVVLIAAAAGLCYEMGPALVARVVPSPLSLALFSAAWLLTSGLAQRRALVAAEELGILFAQPISAVGFARWRLVEASLAHAILALLLGAALCGAAAPAWLCVTAPLAWLAAGAGGGAGLAAAGLVPRLGGLLIVILAAAAGAGLGAAALRGWELALGLAAAGGVAGGLAGLALTPRLFDGAWGRSLGAARGGPGWPARALDLALRPLPSALRALLRRDLLLFGRGALPRGFAVLGALTLVPWVVAQASAGKDLEPWSFELLGLLGIVFTGAVTSFLTSADIPRARRRQQVFERAQPVSGVTALGARAGLAWLLSLPYAAAIVAIAASHPRADLAEVAPDLALGGLILLAVLADSGAAMGLRAELDRSGAEGLAFPIIVGFTGFAWAIAIKFHWACGFAYPLLRGAAPRAAALLYERGEVEAGEEGP